MKMSFETMKDFNDPVYSTSAQRAERVGRTTLARIPVDALSHIAQVCAVVSLDPYGASQTGGRRYGALDVKQRRIHINCYAVEHLSDSALMGLFAHEFGHAYDCAVRGLGPKAKGEDRIAEVEAERWARQWGLGTEIEQLEDESGLGNQ